MFRNPVLTRAADIGMLEKFLTHPMSKRSSILCRKTPGGQAVNFGPGVLV